MDSASEDMMVTALYDWWSQCRECAQLVLRSVHICT